MRNRRNQAKVSLESSEKMGGWASAPSRPDFLYVDDPPILGDAQFALQCEAAQQIGLPGRPGYGQFFTRFAAFTDPRPVALSYPAPAL